MEGLAGNDKINGRDFRDFITGGAGSDTLTGGAGADFFEYEAITDGLDTIVDFELGQGGDAIDIQEVLVGYVSGVSNIAAFVRLSGSTKTTIAVNADGVGTDFVPLATLSTVANTVGLLDSLVANGNLLAA